MIDFAIGLIGAGTSVPSILLALALAPRLSGRLVVVLAIIDLWLLLEVVEALAQPDYGFGSHAVPRLVASAAHVTLAMAVFRRWQQLPVSQDAPVVIAMPRAGSPRRLPVRRPAAEISGSRAA